VAAETAADSRVGHCESRGSGSSPQTRHRITSGWIATKCLRRQVYSCCAIGCDSSPLHRCELTVAQSASQPVVSSADETDSRQDDITRTSEQQMRMQEASLYRLVVVALVQVRRLKFAMRICIIALQRSGHILCVSHRVGRATRTIIAHILAIDITT
jgi:hypothetical protein